MKHLHSLATYGVFICCVFMPGCFLWTSSGKGNDLERSLKDHETRLVAIEEGIKEERTKLAAEVSRAEKKVDQLEDVLEKATAVVQRNSADLGLTVKTLRDQIQVIQGQLEEQKVADQSVLQQLEEIDGRVGQIAQQAGLDVPPRPTDVPSDRGKHFTEAYRAYQAGKYSAARGLFREYVRRYPQDDRADNALYWIGSSYLKQERPATALREYREVITTYRKRDAMDETLYDMAEAFFRLKSCTDSRQSLEALIKQYPKSSLVRQARDKLKKLRRISRRSCP